MHPESYFGQTDLGGKGNINPYNSRSGEDMSIPMMDYERVDIYLSSHQCTHLYMPL